MASRIGITGDHADKIIKNCVANARLEGLSCDEDDVAAMQRIVSGETTLEEELDAVIAAYQKV